MAIEAYTGLPRSGKSYSVVKFVILPSLKAGRVVYTNIPLTEKAHGEFPGLIVQLAGNWHTDPELFAKVPHGAVVVLDELWRRWPKGTPLTKIPFADREFLAEHGHLVDEKGNTTRVVLVTQDLDQLAAFATLLVERTYLSTKLTAIGSSKSFRVDIYQGAAKGQRPPKTRFIRSAYDKYSKDVYSYYQSATKSKTGDVGDESAADKRGSVWRRPIVWAMLASPFLLTWMIWTLISFFENGMSFKKPAPEPQPPVVAMVNPLPPGHAQPRAAVPVQPAQPAAPTLSPVWRVVGYISRSDQPRNVAPHGGLVTTEQPAGTMPNVVVLHSMYGMRYQAMSDCEKISAGVEYQCLIDGYIATPWSGPVTSNVAGSLLAGASSTVHAGAQAVGVGGERSAAVEPHGL
jgi:zona occludens toxin